MHFQKEIFIYFLFSILKNEVSLLQGQENQKTGNMKEWKDAEPAADHMPVTQSLSGIQS